MHSIALALAVQMFFPIFGNSGDSWASLSLINTSASAAEFTVRLNTPDGQETRMVRIPVQAGAQELISLDAWRPGPSVPLTGWIQVDATTDDFKGYLVIGSGERTGAVEPAIDLGITTYLPNVRVRTGFFETVASDTAIAVVNPSQEPADVTLSFVTHDHVPVANAHVEIPARGNRLFYASQFLPGFAAFAGRVTVRSFTPVAAWEQIETPLTWNTLRGRSAAELHLTTVMAAPFFAFGGAENYQSSLIVWNPSEPAVTLEASAYDRNGLRLGESVQFTLQPGQSLSSRLDQLLRIPTVASVPGPLITGAIRLREVQNKPFRVVGNIEMTGGYPQLRSSMVYWLNSSGADVWEFPYVTTSPQYFTSYSVMPANDYGTTPVSVSVEVYDRFGVLVQQKEHSLTQRAFAAELIDPPVPGAYFRIWANQPIVVLGVVGRKDGGAMESISGTR